MTFPNLHAGVLRTVTNDHDGRGPILVHRIFPGPWGDNRVQHVDLVVVPPGSSIGVHRHGDNHETYVVLRGRAQMRWNGRDVAVQEGDLITNPPFGEHGLVNDSGADVHLLVLEVAPCRAEPMDHA